MHPTMYSNAHRGRAIRQASNMQAKSFYYTISCSRRLIPKQLVRVHNVKAALSDLHQCSTPSTLKVPKAEEIATYIYGLSKSQEELLKAHCKVEVVREQALAVKELHVRAQEELEAAKIQALAAANDAGEIGKAHREALQEVIAAGNIDVPAEALEALQSKADALATQFQENMDLVRAAHEHVIWCEAVVARTEELLQTATGRVAVAASLENEAMQVLLRSKAALEQLVEQMTHPGHVDVAAAADALSSAKEQLSISESRKAGSMNDVEAAPSTSKELLASLEAALPPSDEDSGSHVANIDLFAVEPVHINLDRGLSSKEMLAQLREELWQIWEEEPAFVQAVMADPRTCALKDAYHAARAKLSEATLHVATLQAKLDHAQDVAADAAAALADSRKNLKSVTVQVEDAFKLKEYWINVVKVHEERLALVTKVAVEEQLDDLPVGTAPKPVDHHPNVVAARLERDAAQLEITVVSSCIKDVLEKVRLLYAQTERETRTARDANEVAVAASKALQDAIWQELEAAFEVVERQHQLERLRNIL